MPTNQTDQNTPTSHEPFGTVFFKNTCRLFEARGWEDFIGMYVAFYVNDAGKKIVYGRKIKTIDHEIIEDVIHGNDLLAYETIELGLESDCLLSLRFRHHLGHSVTMGQVGRLNSYYMHGSNLAGNAIITKRNGDPAHRSFMLTCS